MKILLITPATHFPRTGAAQQDMYVTIELLQSLGHYVTLYSIDTAAQDPAVLQRLSKRLQLDVRLFRPQDSLTAWLKRAFTSFALFDRSASVFDELIRDQAFTSFVTTWQPDAIFSYTSYAWPTLKFAKQQGIRSIFRSHNFEANFYWEMLTAKQKWNPLNLFRSFTKRLGEKHAATYSDVIATTPLFELDSYRAWSSSPIHILPITQLSQYIRPPHVQPNKKPLDIFYLGASYNVTFHLRGAELLIEQIAPALLAKAPGDFRFHICGAKLPARLIQQCDGVNLIYENYVPDLEAFLTQMDIGAFPVWTGRSIKGKVFESLCRAFPIVIPSFCVMGYELRHEQEVLIADTVDQFVQQLARLTSNALREQLSVGAAAFANREFAAGRIKDTLQAILKP